MRSRDLEQLKWLYRMTHTKIKVEAFSLIHYLKQDHWTMRTIRFSLLYTNRVCLTLEVTRLVETGFQETLKIFEIFLRRMNHFASNSVINFVPNQTCECVYADNGVAA